MALNLSLSEADLLEQNRKNEAEQMRGDVKEVSQGPERDNKPIEVAMGTFRNIARPSDPLSELFYEAGQRNVRTTTESNQPFLTPTEQERALIQNNPNYSERQTKEEAAKSLLSPEGQKTFKERRFQADVPADQIQQENLLNEAQEALDVADPDAIPVEDAFSTNTFIQESKNAVQAEKQGFDFGDKNMASEQFANRVLLEQQEAIKLANDEAGFNFDRIDAPDSVKNIIQTTAKELEKETNVITQSLKGNATATNKETLAEASKLIVDEVGFTRRILRRKVAEGALKYSEIVAARLLLHRSAQRVEQLARKIQGKLLDDNGEVIAATQQDRLAFRRQLSIHAGIQLQVKGAQTEAARALQSFNIRVGDNVDVDALRLEAEAARIINDNGANVTTDALARGVLSSINKGKGEFGQLNKFIRDGWYAKSKKAVHEAYLGGLLWQTATQFKNVLGTGSFMLYETLLTEPAAGLIGAGYRKFMTATGQGRKLTEEQVYLNDFLIRMMAWGDSFKDGLKIGGIAAKTEVPSSQVNRADLEDYTTITSGQDGQYTLMGSGIDFLGKTARIPFRGMLFADEFFKTISQRGELYVRAHHRYQHALRNGMTRQEAADEAGMLLLDPKSIGDELDYKGRYDTMMSDLKKFGKFMGVVQRTLVGRFLFPFVVAPTNSILRSAENVPYIPSKTHFEMLGSYNPLEGGTGMFGMANSNNKKVQMAWAKASVGMGVMYTVGSLALERKITGALPRDKKVRDALPPGWQPYSIVLKDEGWPVDEDGNDLPLYDDYGRPNGPLKYVSYAGFEPVGAMLGITADAVQRSILTRDPEMRVGYIQAGYEATKDYYLNLPMLQGLMDIVKVFDVNGARYQQLLRGPAENASILAFPNVFSGLQRMVNRLTDPIKKRASVPVTYWTEDEILEQIEKDEVWTEPDLIAFAKEQGVNPNFNLIGQKKKGYRFEKPDGSPDYRMVGMEKNTTGVLLKKVFDETMAYASKDSMFRDENIRNATLYDTLGQVLGAEDVSLATAPAAAIFGNITGFKVSLGRTQTDLEKELVRVAVMTNGWPLSEVQNKKERIKFSNKVLEQWIDLSKNQTRLNPKGVVGGIFDFRGALTQLIKSRPYRKYNDYEKVAAIKRVERQYMDAGWERLLMTQGDKEIDRLKRAYETSQKYRERGLQ